VLIAVFGPGWLFAADAASFLVSLTCLSLLRVPPRPLPPSGSFVADLAEGWHELAARPWYWINLFAHACGNFAIPALFVLGPVIAARSLGGATAWGALSASWGVGAVAGGIVRAAGQAAAAARRHGPAAGRPWPAAAGAGVLTLGGADRGG
jgi:hypothetical protein